MRPARLAPAAVAAALLVLGGARDASAQSWRTVTLSRQKGDERSLAVKVAYGAGTFRLAPSDQGLLYRMQLKYDEDRFQPRTDFDGHTLSLGVEGTGKDINLRHNEGGSLDLTLARDLPMDLTLAFGAVQADVDLGGLSLTDLDLQTGASESTVDVSSPNPVQMRSASLQVGAADFTARHLGNLNAHRLEVSAGVGDVTLDLTGAWSQDADVAIKMGLGSLDLRLPEGLGVRLRKKTFLTALDSQGLVKRGDDYYSPDWDSAKRRITIDVNAAFGSVNVSWVP